MFERILLAVDGSDHAIHATDRAARIAEKFGGEIHVIFVMTGAPIPSGLRHMVEVEYETPSSGVSMAPVPEGRFPASVDMTDRDRQEDERRIAVALLDRAASRIREVGRVRVEQVLEAGDPAEAILVHAKRENTDLIVMGSRGLGALKGLLLGSVSSKVSQLAPCCCLLVK